MRLLALAVLAVLALGMAGADARPTACRPLPPNDLAPSWSPDGRSLAFVRSGGSCPGGRAVHIVDQGGRRVTRVASGGRASPPAWSPDGTRLAFVSGAWLTVVSVRGRGLDQLARGGDKAAWSPDGRRIAFTRGNELRIVGVDGSGERLLATGLAAGAPGWSAAGDEILYDGDDGDIHVVDVDSGASRVVGAHPSRDAEPVWAGTTGGILFISARSGGRQLWSVTRDGRLRQETFGPDKTLSPASSRSGFQRAFFRHGRDDPGLHYWPPETTGHFRISPNGAIKPPASFSPDGRFLAWAARGRCGRFGIHVYGPLDAPDTERRRSNQCEFRGTSRRDTMRGTSWPDLIDAGAGDDLVLTRDSYTDTVSCGAGRDRVVADRKDAIAGDCERVQRP